jgi:uncharacterized protein YchJ
MVEYTWVCTELSTRDAKARKKAQLMKRFYCVFCFGQDGYLRAGTGSVPNLAENLEKREVTVPVPLSRGP